MRSHKQKPLSEPVLLILTSLAICAQDTLGQSVVTHHPGPVVALPDPAPLVASPNNPPGPNPFESEVNALDARLSQSPITSSPIIQALGEVILRIPLLALKLIF